MLMYCVYPDWITRLTGLPEPMTDLSTVRGSDSVGPTTLLLIHNQRLTCLLLEEVTVWVPPLYCWSTMNDWLVYCSEEVTVWVPPLYRWSTICDWLLFRGSDSVDPTTLLLIHNLWLTTVQRKWQCGSYHSIVGGIFCVYVLLLWLLWLLLCCLTSCEDKDLTSALGFHI